MLASGGCEPPGNRTTGGFTPPARQYRSRIADTPQGVKTSSRDRRRSRRGAAPTLTEVPVGWVAPRLPCAWTIHTTGKEEPSFAPEEARPCDERTDRPGDANHAHRRGTGRGRDFSASWRWKLSAH